MEKICSRCSKPFNPDDKPIKSLDVNGNPLRIDLCSMCELDNAVEEIAELKHISCKEAEKYIFDKMNEALDSATINKKSIESNRVGKQGFKCTSDFKYTSDEIIPNAVVKAVIDNEVCSD